MFVVKATAIPHRVRAGSPIYFINQHRIVFAAVLVSVERTPDHWLKRRKRGLWGWRFIGKDITFTWVGFREVDSFEALPYPYKGFSWKYIQLDPSLEQRQVDAELLRDYLYERKIEWLSHQKGS